MKNTFCATILIVIASLSFSSSAQEFYNICDILKININGIKKREIEEKTTSDACERFKKTKDSVIFLQPIFLDNSAEDNTSLILSKSNTLPPGPIFDYVKFNSRKKKYYFDKDFFNKESILWPVYESRLNKIMIEKNGIYSDLIPKIHYKKTPDGNFLICEILYVDKNGAPLYIEKNMSYFKENRISISYSSPLIDINDHLSIERLNTVERIFYSIELIHK